MSTDSQRLTLETQTTVSPFICARETDLCTSGSTTLAAGPTNTACALRTVAVLTTCMRCRVISDNPSSMHQQPRSSCSHCHLHTSCRYSPHPWRPADPLQFRVLLSSSPAPCLWHPPHASCCSSCRPSCCADGCHACLWQPPHAGELASIRFSRRSLSFCRAGDGFCDGDPVGVSLHHSPPLGYWDGGRGPPCGTSCRSSSASCWRLPWVTALCFCHHVPVGSLAAHHLPSSIFGGPHRSPTSSSNSRNMACSGVSPALIPPWGNCQAC